MRRRCGSSVCWLSKATLTRNITSGSCTPTATACRKTMLRRCSGIGAPPNEQGDLLVIKSFTLGSCTPDRRQGVPQDYARAYGWFNLAAAHYPPGADREKAVRNRNLLAAQLTPAQLADAQAHTRTWQPKPEDAQFLIRSIPRGGGACPRGLTWGLSPGPPASRPHPHRAGTLARSGLSSWHH